MDALDAVAHGYAIAACTRARELRAALRLLSELRQAGVTPELRSVNMIITCAGHKASLRPFSPHVTPHFSYISPYSSSQLDKKGEPELAIRLLEELEAGAEERKGQKLGDGGSGGALERESALRPSVISYNAALSALAKHGEHERCFELLERMEARGLKPDVSLTPIFPCVTPHFSPCVTCDSLF